jgi:Holliday junction resolvasome RuvABC DNA-binding subunit
VADVRTALTELGYAPDEIAEATKELPQSDDTAELLRLALQRLAA